MALTFSGGRRQKEQSLKAMRREHWLKVCLCFAIIDGSLQHHSQSNRHVSVRCMYTTFRGFDMLSPWTLSMFSFFFFPFYFLLVVFLCDVRFGIPIFISSHVRSVSGAKRVGDATQQVILPYLHSSCINRKESFMKVQKTKKARELSLCCLI